MLAHLSLCLGFLFFGSGTPKNAAKPEIELVRVWPQWRDAASFKRISEYFTGRENPSGMYIRRSRTDSRSGYYYLVRVRHKQFDLANARFVLQVITPDSPEPKAPFSFPVGVGLGEQVFEIGLTGADWPGPRVHPVAWRLELVGADGQILAWAQSFLWSKPGVVAVR